jgi:hypothetical protein
MLSALWCKELLALGQTWVRTRNTRRYWSNIFRRRTPPSVRRRGRARWRRATTTRTLHSGVLRSLALVSQRALDRVSALRAAGVHLFHAPREREPRSASVDDLTGDASRGCSHLARPPADAAALTLTERPSVRRAGRPRTHTPPRPPRAWSQAEAHRGSSSAPPLRPPTRRRVVHDARNTCIPHSSP